jgi:hypothetical protein
METMLPMANPLPADCNVFPNIKYPISGKNMYEINT